MQRERLISIVESILFAAEKPVSLDRIKEAFGETAPSDEDLQSVLTALKSRCEAETVGFFLREAQGGYQFVTKAENAEWVQRFLQLKPFRLGRSSLEVLAIVAYRQPITRAEIDQIRGIDSSHLLRTLMERGLVKMGGKADVPGRPVQYTTMPKFLEVVGFNTLSDLPPLTELDQLQGDTKDPLQSLEEGLDRLLEEEPSTVVMAESDQKGLEELSALIESARHGSKEVHESPIHAEIAMANEEAVIATSRHLHRPRKKKGLVTYHELTAAPAPVEEVVPSEPLVD